MASRLLTIASRPACFPLSQRSRCIVLRQCRRSLFMSRSWYKPEVGKDGKDQLHGKQPRVLYDNVSPVQTSIVSALSLGNFGFFAWFLESANTPGHFVEELPYVTIIGVFGVFGSSAILSSVYRGRSQNIVKIRLYEDENIVELGWHNILGGITTKYCEANAIQPSKGSPDEEVVRFKVPYDRGYFNFARTGNFRLRQSMKNIFGPNARSLEDN
ncbi:hypothetical protein AAMO2058_000524100 [Amorphochlora amoebiformis]